MQEVTASSEVEQKVKSTLQNGQSPLDGSVTLFRPVGTGCISGSKVQNHISGPAVWSSCLVPCALVQHWYHLLFMTETANESQTLGQEHLWVFKHIPTFEVHFITL